MQISRRNLLGSMAAVAVPTSAVIAEKVKELSAMERAKHHFDEMAKALTEMGGDGWTLYASEKQPFGNLSGGRYMGLNAIEYTVSEESGMALEKHRPMFGVL